MSTAWGGPTTRDEYAAAIRNRDVRAALARVLAGMPRACAQLMHRSVMEQFRITEGGRRG